MKIPDIGNIDKYEFGGTGKKKPEWINTRAPYGVDYSKYSSPKWEKWGIDKSQESEVFRDLWEKLDRRLYPGCTVKQFEEYVHQYLGGFLILHKKWPEAYELLMQSNFKIYFITSSKNWHDVYKKHLFKNNTKNADIDHASSAGFFSSNANPPALYINASNKSDDTYVSYTVLHESLHALDFFAGKYSGDGYLSDTFNINSYVNNYNKRLRFVKKKLLALSKTCKTEDEYNKKERKLICDYRLWFIYEDCDRTDEYMPELKNDPGEFFVDIFMYYLLWPEILKPLDRGLYDFIEKEIKPGMAKVNLGLKKRKLFKPK